MYESLIPVYTKRLQSHIKQYLVLDPRLGLEFCRLAIGFFGQLDVHTSYDLGGLLDRIDKLTRDIAKEASVYANDKDWLDFTLERVNYLAEAAYPTEDPAMDTKLRTRVADPDTLWDVQNDKVISIQQLIKSYALASACILDRHAVIVPQNFVKDASILMDTYVTKVFNGILVQGEVEDHTFYYVCPNHIADRIMKEGISADSQDYDIFGAGVIYASDKFEGLTPWSPSSYTVLKLRYSGPSLNVFWVQPSESKGSWNTLLYPHFVTAVQKLETPWHVPNPKWDPRVAEVTTKVFHE